MRFWTALQDPLRQAVYVEDGKIVRGIPGHPPKTPARMVDAIGHWDDDHILIGRRASIELWNRNGKELVQQVYHPWIYNLHVVQRWRDDMILVGCSELDCVFALDWDGNVQWSWFACDDGLSAELNTLDAFPVKFDREAGTIDSPNVDWQIFQLSKVVEVTGTAHVNSVRPFPGGRLMVTLGYVDQVVVIDPDKKPIRSGNVMKTGSLPHDAQLDTRGDRARLVNGVVDGLCINGKLLFETMRYPYVKRVYQVGTDMYAFTYDGGVVVCRDDGSVLQECALPKPWHLVHLEL